jgi:hypothetical protein
MTLWVIEPDDDLAQLKAEVAQLRSRSEGLRLSVHSLRETIGRVARVAIVDRLSLASRDVVHENPA